MKLEKYVDKSKKKRKVILISLVVIGLISVTLLLYKTFASFTESVEFPIIKGQVDYFGNSDVYFAFYKDEEKLDVMPAKDNSDNLIFSHGECDNGASVIWDVKSWAPLIKNLNKSKTKCSLYFVEQKFIKLGSIDIPIVLNGDGLYEVEHNVSEISTDWNKTEYRYAGPNPNNYVKYNNEIWRIIGLVNVKTENGVEQRIKIVRQDGIEGQKDFGNYAWDRAENYTNNWTTSKLKDMLNGIYYASGSGECYNGGSPASKNICDFTGNGLLPKGLDSESQNMIDKNIIFNIGAVKTYPGVTIKQSYEAERGSSTGIDNNFPSEWSIPTNVGENFNGIVLIYPSDYGFATSGGFNKRNECFEKKFNDWKNDENYQHKCLGTDWLKPNKTLFTLTPSLGYIDRPMIISDNGSFYDTPASFAITVWPTLYLKNTITITSGNGTLSEPYELSI